MVATDKQVYKKQTAERYHHYESVKQFDGISQTNKKKILYACTNCAHDVSWSRYTDHLKRPAYQKNMPTFIH